MKLNNSILIGFLAIAALSSCVSEDLPSGEIKGGKGTMLLKVATAEPQTRANSAYTQEQLDAMKKVTNYPVSIYNASNERVGYYETVSQFPSEGLVMSVGEYKVESHTPGEMEKKMTTPYYSGTEAVSIRSGVTTDVDVVCKMQNSKIQLVYSEDFLKLYSSWSITIDDGGNDVLSFTNADGNAPAPIYWVFDEGVESLTVQFRATLASDGSPVSDTKTLSKDNFLRPYPDDDSQAFSGGDQIIFTFNPSDATTGAMGITISATVTFDETNETETVYLTDNGLVDDGGDNPNPGDDPNVPADENPSLECTGGWNVSFSASEDEENLPHTEVVVNTPKGLKSLKVKITGGNAGFAGATGGMHDAGADDLEIIGSEDLGDIFDGVDGAELPNSGDKIYKFPVYAFFSMIQMFGATDAGKAHEFYMVAEDNEGNVVTNTLKITVTQ